MRLAPRLTTFALASLALLLSAPGAAQVTVLDESFEPGWAVPTWPTWGWTSPLYINNQGVQTEDCIDVWGLDASRAHTGQTSLRVDGSPTDCTPNDLRLLNDRPLGDAEVSLHFYDDGTSDFTFRVSAKFASAWDGLRFFPSGDDYLIRQNPTLNPEVAAPRTVGWHQLRFDSGRDPQNLTRIWIYLDGILVGDGDSDCSGCGLGMFEIDGSGNGSVWIDDLAVIDNSEGPVSSQRSSMGSLKSRIRDGQ